MTCYDAGGRVERQIAKVVDGVFSATALTTSNLTYRYSGRGDRLSLGYPSGATIDYGYFNDGQLREVRQGSATLATYAYDLNGQLAQVARANGAVTNYGYDGADRLRAVRTLNGGVIAARQQLQLDPLGLRTVITDTLPLNPAPSPTRLKTMTFEADNLTDPVSGADAVVGTVAIERFTPLQEFYAARVSNTANSYLQEDIAPQDDLYVAFALQVTTRPSADAELATIRNGTTTVGNLMLTSAGRLRLRNGTTVLGVDSAIPPLC